MPERPPRYGRSRRARLASLRDLGPEALAAVLQRPVRSALTALGTVLGVGAFVATIGLTTTTEAQVGERFDLLKATEITVQDTIQDPAARFPFPQDAEHRLGRLNGVRGSGLLWSVDVGGAKVGSSWQDDDDLVLDIAAASPGALKVLKARTAPGRTFDEFANRRRERVVLLGKAAARELGIADVRTQPAVLVGGMPFTVIGIIDDLARRLELLRAVVVPAQTALAIWRNSFAGAPAMVVETDPGAAQLIGRQAPLALRPDRPEALLSLVPPEPRELRRGVESDLGGLLIALAAVSLFIGAVGIANTTLVSVLERTGEIGLRRALGATGAEIAGQFLAESAIVGALGGVLGACVGVIAVSVISTVRDWSVVIDPMAVLAAPAIGLATGLLAGLYPAVKASRVEPIAALRA